MGYVKVTVFVLTLDCCQSYVGRCQAKEVSTSVKYLFEKFTKVCPTGHAMQLDCRDDAMVCDSLLNPFITSVMQGVIALCREFSQGPLRDIVVYRIVAVVLVCKDSIPELFQVVQSFCQIRASFRCVLCKFHVKP